MYEPIEECIAGTNDGWAKLWVIYEREAAQSVRRLLARAEISETEADDVDIEVFEHLREQDCQRLQSFRGTSEAQFSEWLVHVSKNLAHNWIDGERRRTDRERKMRKCLPIADRTGPTIGQVLSLLQDWEAVLSRKHIDRLREMLDFGNALSESDSPAPDLHATVSQRTWQRLKKELEEVLRGS
jgi:DNA-directed RNA polymerase specialized sigma24 family protein